MQRQPYDGRSSNTGGRLTHLSATSAWVSPCHGKKHGHDRVISLIRDSMENNPSRAGARWAHGQALQHFDRKKSASPVCRLSLRAHELEGVDDLLVVRTQVDDTSALGGEFVFIQCRHWITEHQRIDNPDSGRLHLSECPLVFGPIRTPCPQGLSLSLSLSTGSPPTRIH